MPIDLTKLQETAPGLVNLYKTARVSLDKHRLGGVRAAVYLVIDHSRSMSRYFKDGSVQGLAERVLALAAHFDDDGTVPVVFFDSHARQPVNISVSDYAGSIDRIKSTAGVMGSTDYASAMRAIIELHARQSGPAFVVFQTDGAPNSKRETTEVLCEAARLPIFWQFIGFGDDEFAYLRRLDDLPVPAKRVVDNAGFFPAGKDPRSIPDDRLYDELMAEFPQWLGAARAAGILR
ncbi:toxic cation resistance protein [Virgisporangium aliadipatigenens]|uniref:Toxic cation resistance protein n=1 Tax=Virgisporangium aliadipatigenens TaxID=741659 RepID=A0A8J3YHX8_9ACTN|nr:VWA domain-containing protein [Virgisporangium aliadipatigenens]GIJ44632.1 toxic cation resistance protein [Virgisporangium aliadipatigenens]